MSLASGIVAVYTTSTRLWVGHAGGGAAPDWEPQPEPYKKSNRTEAVSLDTATSKETEELVDGGAEVNLLLLD